ncbi:hypothetical protein BZA70DRAFT_35168 [Myxozyma melibiosi]|uniref:Lipid droplet-associated hydrolase n=1 Tax=Myxozyma melibiosi TaxID=54550 RepID=A0ABR1FE25_9ASCO
MAESLFKLQKYPHEYPTTIYDVPPDAATEECGMIFLIPGNPGLPEYYVPFLSQAREGLPGWRIVCVSQAGYDTVATAGAARSSDQKYYGLEQQTQHKVEVLTSLLQKYSYFSTVDLVNKKQVVVVGHSIGCWMIQRMLAKLAKQQIPAPITLAVLLFPTIRDLAQSSSGMALKTISSYVPRLADFVSIFTFYAAKYLPSSALHTIIKLAMRNPPEHALHATTQLVGSPAVVWQSISLGIEEMGIHGERDDMAEFFWDGPWGTLHSESSKQGRIVAYFAESDHWVADRTRAEILEAHAKRENVSFNISTAEENCKHAFCVKDSDVMAKRLVDWVTELDGH